MKTDTQMLELTPDDVLGPLADCDSADEVAAIRVQDEPGGSMLRFTLPDAIDDFIALFDEGIRFRDLLARKWR
jgi:hypothetical protein